MNSDRQYKFHETIGTGAQGTVRRATSPTGEVVAYKVFQPDPNSSDIALDRNRFISEIRIQSTLSHAGIVSVIEENVDVNGYPYYTMELADSSLQQMVDTSARGMKPEKALVVFEKICVAMAFAHTQDVLHRDLKPKNILMYSGSPRVADFGLGRNLALATVTHSAYEGLIGSDGYMAPEQKRNFHEAGKPADVYSLGKILYFMLTKLHPAAVQMDRIPSSLQFLIFKCIQDDPADRFEDGVELLNQVRNIISGDSSELAPPADQLRAALAAVAHGEPDSLSDVSRVLLSNPDDSALYMTALPKAHKSVLISLTKQQPGNIRSIVANFDEHVRDNTTWSYADTIANFLEPIFKATSDQSLRQKILYRVLQQGYENNRFHVGIVFGQLCQYVWETQFYAEMIADLLRNNPQTKRFVAQYLDKEKMPAIVSAEIR